jgi:undecaprenyl-diphosphatase
LEAKINWLIEEIKSIDTQLFLLMNGMHSPFFDKIMYWASLRSVWIPFYIFLLYLVYKAGKKIIPVVFVAALMLILTDKGSVLIFKNTFLRYRPCHNLEIMDIVHVLPKCGGTYGFVSSHASNTFALALFLSFLIGRNYRFLIPGLFVWAAFVSYSRIYCGQHYPADIIVGALYGMFIALLIWKLYKFIIDKRGNNIATL